MNGVRKAVAALPEAPDLVTAIRAFQSGLGIPETLADIGVSAGNLAAVARGALADANAPTSPRPLSIGNATELLNNAINKT